MPTLRDGIRSTSRQAASAFRARRCMSCTICTMHPVKVESQKFKDESSRCTFNFELSTFNFQLSTLNLFPPDAVQIPVRPQQQVAVADDGAGVGAAVVIGEGVMGQLVELRPGGDDVGAGKARDIVDLAV